MPLRETRQFAKATYSIIPSLQNVGKDKTVETVKRSVVARSSEGGRDTQAEFTKFLGQRNYSLW